MNRDNLIVKDDRDLPQGVKCVWLLNRYDEKRAHLVVYNWRKQPSVDVPAGPFLRRGDRFVLKDP